MIIDYDLLNFSTKSIAQELLDHSEKVLIWKIQGCMTTAMQYISGQICYGLVLFVKAKRHCGDVSIVLDDMTGLFNIYLLENIEGQFDEKVTCKGVPLQRIIETLSTLLE